LCAGDVAEGLQVGRTHESETGDGDAHKGECTMGWAVNRPEKQRFHPIPERDLFSIGPRSPRIEPAGLSRAHTLSPTIQWARDGPVCRSGLRRELATDAAEGGVRRVGWSRREDRVRGGEGASAYGRRNRIGDGLRSIGHTSSRRYTAR
jgi:hypothetical protein